MIVFLIFLLAAIGASHIMVDGSIFDSFRTWLGKPTKYKIFSWMKNKLLGIYGCYQCSGWHSAAAIALMLKFCNMHLLGTGWLSWIVDPFVCGCAGSFMSVLAALIIARINKGIDE